MPSVALPAERPSPNGYLVGLVGSGIGPSLSPPLHEREARALGLDYRYRRLDLDLLGVAPGAIGDLLAAAHAAGYHGLNITHPCKQLVMPHLDELSPDAAAIGAVNTVVLAGGRSVGHNTDWSGFRHGLEDGLPGVGLGRVVLLGAGGAGAAAAHALLTVGVGRLTVLDVDAARADRLAGNLAARFGTGRAVAGDAGRDLDRHVAGADGLVHATPTGMAAHPGLPLAPDLLRPQMWVADIVYRPLDTALLQAARGRGCRTLDGGRMAVHQAVDAFRLFTGAQPDAHRMLGHFAELVATAEEDDRAHV
ncbi:shikimate dehydrogenase [Pseudonocardia nigra]|uniref:shikimate dehydrogenase n=1 Tax=Pseudonocardia nigra TaxID=1921578 RepID=UPI001C603B34|nr:shikimate dehydrogenase [Pseudonocardia nigra]